MNMYAVLVLHNPKNDHHYMATNHTFLLVYTNNVLAPSGDVPQKKVHMGWTRVSNEELQGE